MANGRFDECLITTGRYIMEHDVSRLVAGVVVVVVVVGQHRGK